MLLYYSICLKEKWPALLLLESGQNSFVWQRDKIVHTLRTEIYRSV